MFVLNSSHVLRPFLYAGCAPFNDLPGRVAAGRFAFAHNGFKLLLLGVGDAEQVDQRGVFRRVQRRPAAPAELDFLPVAVLLCFGFQGAQLIALGLPARIDLLGQLVGFQIKIARVCGTRQAQEIELPVQRLGACRHAVIVDPATPQFA
ncbi:hypothetical protein D3C71_1699190 [compost metagenome]